jgi:hypothetical protein
MDYVMWITWCGLCDVDYVMRLMRWIICCGLSDVDDAAPWKSGASAPRQDPSYQGKTSVVLPSPTEAARLQPLRNCRCKSCQCGADTPVRFSCGWCCSDVMPKFETQTRHSEITSSSKIRFVIPKRSEESASRRRPPNPRPEADPPQHRGRAALQRRVKAQRKGRARLRSCHQAPTMPPASAAEKLPVQSCPCGADTPVRFSCVGIVLR